MRHQNRTKHVHHGRTTAAWTASMMALAGFVILFVAFTFGQNGFTAFNGSPTPMPNMVLTIIGAILVVAAPIVGGALNLAGKGQD
ncbi:hypothetical protein [Granulicoccus phenolivorans]|uniref:hypothetical protein n=1 Tax=Granulicoccus phenolivorans TaxID=266854 RepID=UPI0011AE1AFD|nr:hypothetical protein [Granulicoccus phenolivorans]